MVLMQNENNKTSAESKLIAMFQRAIRRFKKRSAAATTTTESHTSSNKKHSNQKTK